VITGAGIIAIEYAKIFTKLGAKVTMLVRRAARDSIARLGLDEDIVSALLGDLKESGVTVQASHNHTHTHTHTRTHALAVTPHRHTHALVVRTVILSHPYARTSSADARAFLHLAPTLTH
jgi:pyruvate/2-oxoglutarate dehydrogenase complex dihydrolipoamide dehydrogenase (E3) component